MKLTPPCLTARALLVKYGLERDDQVPVDKLLAARGLMVRQEMMGGAEGRLVRRKDTGIVTLSSEVTLPGKRRFVLAHELGHFELHADSPVFACDAAAFTVWNQRRPEEYEANVFAAEVLMPVLAFRETARDLPPEIDSVRLLARRFGATLSATAIRCANLGVWPCAVAFTQDGLISWVCTSDDYPYRRARRGAVHPYSGANEFYQGRAVTANPALTPVSAWFTDDGAGLDEQHFEACLTMSRLNCTLSLIWPS